MPCLELKPFLMQLVNEYWKIVQKNKKNAWNIFPQVHLFVFAGYSCDITYVFS